MHLLFIFFYLYTYYIHIINILHSIIYNIFLDGGGIWHGGLLSGGICPDFFLSWNRLKYTRSNKCDI